jgi:Ca-activated chloride channel family protein
MRFFLAFAALVVAAPLTALEVALVAPEPGQAVFGPVEIRAEVYPLDAAIERVDFFVDGQFRGRAEQSPFELLLDVGQENAEHEFTAVAHGADGTTATASLRTPRLRSDLEVEVDLQQLYITAERRGSRVLDLTREQFSVFDDGVRQQIVTFERGDVPFTAVVLLDASLSMQGQRLRTALAGARALVDGMQTLDQAKLILFSDRLLHETPFTSFPSVLSVGLAGVRAQGGTALNDHLYLALKRLQRDQGRRVVILLSDGFDVESALDIEQVRKTPALGRSLLYWIRLDQGKQSPDTTWFSAWRDGEGHRRQLELLERTVLESGGDIVTPADLSGVEDSFVKILDELRSQYVIGYYAEPAHRDGRWRRVEVDVPASDVRLRARVGYYDLPGG